MTQINLNRKGADITVSVLGENAMIVAEALYELFAKEAGEMAEHIEKFTKEETK